MTSTYGPARVCNTARKGREAQATTARNQPAQTASLDDSFFSAVLPSGGFAAPSQPHGWKDTSAWQNASSLPIEPAAHIGSHKRAGCGLLFIYALKKHSIFWALSWEEIFQSSERKWLHQTPLLSIIPLVLNSLSNCIQYIVSPAFS